MNIEKWRNEICGREEREKLREKYTQTPIRPKRKPHRLTKTPTRDSSGGRRASNSLRHGAARIIIIIIIIIIYYFYYYHHRYCGGSVAQAVRCSPPIARVPSSSLDHSMWVSLDETESGQMFLRVSLFSPVTNFILPFLHIRLIYFLEFHYIRL